jgi:hypothetical protein
VLWASDLLSSSIYKHNKPAIGNTKRQPVGVCRVTIVYYSKQYIFHVGFGFKARAATAALFYLKHL